MAELLEIVSTEQDAFSALDKLNRVALQLTEGRNALIAQMDDDEGCLEISHGVGQDWYPDLIGKKLEVDTGAEEGVVAYVAATGSGFLSGNVEKEARYRNLFGTTRSEIALPVRDRYGRIRAVLNIESDQLNAFNAEHYEVCLVIAQLAAIVLDRQESHLREEALIEVGQALDRASSEDELVERVIHIAGEVLRFQAFSVFLYDRASEAFVLRGSVGRLKDKVGQVSYKRGDGCTGWVCETGLSLRLEASPQQDPRWRGRYVEFPTEQIASFLAVPVISRGRCIGALRAIRKVTENPYLDNRFTEGDERVLIAIAEQLASGVEGIRAMERMLHTERMVAWGELSAKSSHMIGNRVFALKGDVNELGHVLESREPDLSELRALQKSLGTNVTRVEEILQDFRDFLTATQLARSPGDINELVKESVTEVFPKRSAIQLTFELSQNLPPVAMDRVKLRRAISELIENSMNFIESGEMHVETSLPSSDWVRMASLTPSRGYVAVTVADNGPGVPEENKQMIFQPFFSSRVKGMGLGLSIVKGIVEAHGGSVIEVGTEGEGAKFVILLPVVERQ